MPLVMRPVHVTNLLCRETCHLMAKANEFADIKDNLVPTMKS